MSVSPFAWRAHPARERPGHGISLVLVILGVMVLVWGAFPEPVWAVGSGVVLLLAFLRFFLPTDYGFEEKEITARFLGVVRRYRWDQFRRFEAGPQGVFLSPFATSSRLDSYRGLYLLYGGHREEVLAIVRKRLDER